MSDRNNTIFGWVLGAGIVALGFTSLSSMYFRSERPEEMAYPIEGAGGGGAAEGPAIETLLATADVTKGEQLFAKCAACHTITPGGAAGRAVPVCFGVGLAGTDGPRVAEALCRAGRRGTRRGRSRRGTLRRARCGRG